MAPDDASRSDLFALLEPRVGRDAALELMNHIPPEGWPEFATKADLELLRTAARSDFELLGARLDRRIDVLEQRVSGEVARMNERISGLGARLEERIDRSEQRVVAAFRGELNSTITAQGWHLIGAVISTAVAVLGAVRFG
jgi:hypothetical protein